MEEKNISFCRTQSMRVSLLSSCLRTREANQGTVVFRWIGSSGVLCLIFSKALTAPQTQHQQQCHHRESLLYASLSHLPFRSWCGQASCEASPSGNNSFKGHISKIGKPSFEIL